MTLRHRFLFLGLFLVLPGVGAQAAGPLASIHMPGSSQKAGSAFDGLDIPLTKETVAVNLDPGQSLDDQAIVLVPGRDAEPGRFKVQSQYETSVTMIDKGPHLDLLDGQHYRSEWKDLEQVGDLEYRMPTYTEEDKARFIKVSPLQIYVAALEAGGSRWTDTVLSVKGPNDYPAAVGISTVRLRVLVQDGNAWKELHQVELKLPTGC